MEAVNIKDWPREKKVALLRKLGFDVKDNAVLLKGEQHYDKYDHEPVMLDTMAIGGGSAIVMNDTPFSILSYLAEHGESSNDR